ncbi:tRNA-dependent cyclodipeptide synthase [Nocardiopsis halotolerans]|uniref:tRNA-dependent cyclodipeptide synthase n=1 Tax=Nocardiopsis halotolerans TaxID=124252 RepID=UPI00034A33E1|nr:tRNA-dependent cyclodipeptide synthase [Nocardiopsis halotolerans]
MSSPRESKPSDASVDDFEVQPFTEACRRLLVRGEHALVGVSAGNSYFSQQRIAQLLCWAQRRFAAVDLLYVDLHLDTMYRASGGGGGHASARASRAVRDVRRRIRRAVESVATGTVTGAGTVRVRALSQCVDLPGYQAVRQRIDREIAIDSGIRRACEEHVRCLLGAQPDPDGARLRAGLAYLGAELPFLLSTPEVLGVSSSVSCYHTLLPVLSRLWEVTSCAHPGQGHVVVRPPEGN